MSQVEMDLSILEKNSRALSGLFQTIVNDMKGSTVVWEDFNNKAAKLHVALRSTNGVIASFLDAFQKVADLANGSRGATRDIGAALTRLCIRHRSIETKLRAFTAAITEAVTEPLQMRVEEWKKTTLQLDKDHAKEYKKVQQEIKKASSDTIRLQKRTKKGQGDLRHRLENAMQDVHAKYVSLEEIEKRAVRCAMIEERSRFCSFISFLTPLMDHEISMLTEVTHLQEIIDVLAVQTADPTTLPQSSEQVILDLKESSDGSQNWTCTPPGSPRSLGSHLGSHRSSACSINSSSSSSLQSNQGIQQALVTTPQLHLSATPFTPVPSTLSNDSGYASQDFVPADFGREMSLRLGDEITLNSIPVNAEGLVDDSASSMSNFPSYAAGTMVAASWPHSPGYFKPSASTPAFFEPSTFYERPHTISYSVEHSHGRPALTALTFEPPSNTKSQNASNQSLPSSLGNCAVPSNAAVTMRLPKMAEDGEMVADIYARPSLQGQRRSGVAPCPVAPPTVPEKFYTLQTQQSKTDMPQPIYMNAFDLNSKGKPETIDTSDGKTDEQNSSSPCQSLCRSFSFPVQSTVLPTSGQNKFDLPMAGPPDTRSEKGFVLTSETVTEFDGSGKSSTLPRMPQFKVPLVPQRYLSTMSRNSGNVGPPTLPKRSSSKLSGRPPAPVRCNSAKSTSVERMASAPAAPVILNTSSYRHSMDTSSFVSTEMGNPSDCRNARIQRASSVDAKSNGHDAANMESGMSQDTEDDSSKLMAADGLMHSLRQQAPPSDDSDQLRPLPVQPETVIPLFEEVLECSFTQMHSPIHDSIASPVRMPPESSGDSSAEVSATEDNMLEIIKRGVILRRTVTNDRSAPRMTD